MEIDTDDSSSSPCIIPESPPTFEPSNMETDQDLDKTIDIFDSDDDEDTTDARDSKVKGHRHNPSSLVKGQPRQPLQKGCDFNVAIDIDIDIEDSDSEQSQGGLVPTATGPTKSSTWPKPMLHATKVKVSPPRGHVQARFLDSEKGGVVHAPVAPTSTPHQSSANQSKVKGHVQARPIKTIDPEDPFALDEDDRAIMAQVDEMEKSFNFNEPNYDPVEPVSPSLRNHSDVDLEGMEEREKKYREEFKNLKRLGPNERIFPDVRPSNFHTVAFSIEPDNQPGDQFRPHPVVFQSRWDPQFVPMPRDRENVRIFKIRQQKDPSTSVASSGALDNTEEECPPTFVEKKVWMWQRIDQTLKEPILTCEDISSCLKHYCRVGMELRALDYCIESIMSTSEREDLFTKVLPSMQRLCLDFNRIVTCPLPLLGKFSNYSISLTQKQIACLLANAFFSTFPKRLRDEMQFPSINFVELFQCPDESDNSRLITKAHKIRCILHYFTRITEEMPQGVVTFTRRSIRNSKAPEWQNSTKKLTKIIPLSQGTIEDDGVGMLQVDFANKIIGGGVLGGGAVQEEILFVTYPELLISRLFTEKLTSCEALIVTGCERFSRYSGYARNFRFDGDFYDVTPSDSKGRKCSQIVAIDALYITRPITQFHPRFLTRELNKAYVGFSSPTLTSVPVATGKWGCGAFNGNPQLKAILQLMAASQAGRDLVFFTFGDHVIQKEIEEIYSVIQDMTIQQVWNLLNQYHSLFCVTSQSKYTLCRFLKEFGCHPPPPQPGSSTSSKKEPENVPKKLREVPLTKFYTKESRNTYKPHNFNIIHGNGDLNDPSDPGSSTTSHVPTDSDTETKLHEGCHGQGESEATLSDDQIALILDQREAATNTDSKVIASSIRNTTSNSKNNSCANEQPKLLSLTDFYK